MLIYQTRPPTAVTHKPQMKRKRKGSRDFPFRIGNVLAAGVSRASSATWALSARPLVLHVHRAPTCASPITSLHQHTDSDLYSAVLSLQLPCTTPHTHTLSYSVLQHFSPPSFGRVSSISANRERTRPPPPAFLVTVTGSFFMPDG